MAWTTEKPKDLFGLGEHFERECYSAIFEILQAEFPRV
jgi:hypothetical protein